MTEYLKKSDVMALAELLDNGWLTPRLEALPTFPDPSLAGWQDISSAPRDGTPVLFYGKWKPYDILEGGSDCIRIFSWGTLKATKDNYGWYSDGLLHISQINVEFTHWMPLPPAPSVDAPTPNRTDTDWQTKITAAPLKLEAGKLYRTRDGRKAFVSIVKSDCNCVHGMVEEYYESITWCLDGRHYSDGKTAHIDLISLWDEPAPESDTSKLLEMIDKLETAYANNKPVRTELLDILREIARLLAERGDK